MKLRDNMIEALTAAGITAQAAKLWKAPRAVEKNTVAVAVTRLRAVQSAMERYLGTDDQGRERYGMALTAEVTLSLLSPKDQGGQGGEDFAEEVVNLLLQGVEGFPVGEIEAGSVNYDPGRDSFLSEVKVTASVMAYGVKEETEIRFEKIVIQPSYA